MVDQKRIEYLFLRHDEMTLCKVLGKVCRRVGET